MLSFDFVILRSVAAVASSVITVKMRLVCGMRADSRNLFSTFLLIFKLLGCRDNTRMEVIVDSQRRF